MDEDALPSGTVTFVFTDIEGSTQLLRRLGHGYDAVLRRSVDVLVETWQSHGGHPLPGAGDSTFAAFESAAAAVSACVEGQRRLAAESWPEHGRPAVRMGAHTGLAVPRDGAYVALAVHQAVRVMTAAHGGEILISEQCADEAGDVPAVQLVPLGRYRIRDFDTGPRLYRVAARGLRREFPAIRAVPVDGHNLVPPPTPLVGRAQDVMAVVAGLAPGRVQTLLGPGGVGKTRLAVEVGIVAARGWDDGVWLVDLAPLQDEALVGSALAAAVGAPVSAGSDRWQDAMEHLARLRALVVLDNCDHLVDELVPRLSELLARCPGVGMLATSRERLGMPQEGVWPVRPLPLPAGNAPLADAASTPSVELFLQRARSVCPSFVLDEGTVGAVVGICRRLDGLPLALELAASQMSVLPPARLLAGLEDRFAVLRSRDRGRPDRQRTMEAAIDWSVRLLAPQERTALRRLAVFAKDFSLEAAAPALADGSEIVGGDVPELVWQLAERSLVSVDLTGNDSRYRLLETVRAYSWRLLEEHGEAGGAAERLGQWWVDRLGPWQPMDRLRAAQISDELENLRWLVPLLAGTRPELAQQLACTIARYYYAGDTPLHSIDELSGYAKMLPAPSAARVSLLTTLSNLHVRHGDIASARAAAALAAGVQRACGGPPPWDDVAVERARGEVALRSSDYEQAGAIARAALERGLTSRGRARMLNLLGLSSHFAGDDAAAAAAFDQELLLARSLDDDHLTAIAEGNLAELALRYGDLTTAARHQRACLDLGMALGSEVQIAYSMVTAAALAASADPVLSVRLNAKAQQVLSENGHQLYDEDLAACEQMSQSNRRILGDAPFDAESAAGRALLLPDAAQLAGQALDRVATPEHDPVRTTLRSGT